MPLNELRKSECLLGQMGGGWDIVGPFPPGKNPLSIIN